MFEFEASVRARQRYVRKRNTVIAAVAFFAWAAVMAGLLLTMAPR